MLNRDQEQHVAEGGTAIQAGGNVTVTQAGMTYADARNIALDVFRANFHALVGIAKDTASARAEEITGDFLSKLQKEFPSGLERAQDPDFQYALFTVQKEYARNGDKDLGDLLVDLLVDRSKQKQRDILQIVLNESLNTAPKLTESQLAALSVRFLFEHTQNNGIGCHEDLGRYFDRYVSPFAAKLARKDASYRHLEFCGCGTISALTWDLPQILGNVYQGLFLKGFDEAEVSRKGISIGPGTRFFVRCLNDPSKIQVGFNNKESLEQALEAHTVPPEDRGKIVNLFDVGKMSNEEVKEKCIQIRPYMPTVFDIWADSPMKHLNLTSVGMAIAHANIKRLVGEFANLSIWIN